MVGRATILPPSVTIGENDMARTALITGAGAGIGRACSLRLARDGINVGVLGRNHDECAAVVAEIVAEGGNALALCADITADEQIDLALAKLRSLFGPVTILVNNAGRTEFKPFEEITPEDWRCVLEVNLVAACRVTQACIPDMKDVGWGRIVNISSSSAQSGSPRQVHYSASKGAMIAMTRSLALEVGSYGITVNNIPPGLVMQTKMAERNRHLFTNRNPEDLGKNLPVGRAGIPDDVAAACAWLVSEDAGYVTGQTIGVNGGRIMN